MHTNSWGCARAFGTQELNDDCNFYGSQARIMVMFTVCASVTKEKDDFMANNPSMLILFAAGNDGGDVYGGFGTLGSPGTPCVPVNRSLSPCP